MKTVVLYGKDTLAIGIDSPLSNVSNLAAKLTISAQTNKHGSLETSVDHRLILNNFAFGSYKHLKPNSSISMK